MPEHTNPPTADELRAKLDQSPYGELLRDTARRRQAVYDGLAESVDPIAREIGQQLREGRLRPIDLLRSAEYRQFLERGAAQLRRIDLEELARQADAATAEARERDGSGDDSRRRPG